MLDTSCSLAHGCKTNVTRGLLAGKVTPQARHNSSAVLMTPSSSWNLCSKVLQDPCLYFCIPQHQHEVSTNAPIPNCIPKPVSVLGISWCQARLLCRYRRGRHVPVKLSIRYGVHNICSHWQTYAPCFEFDNSQTSLKPHGIHHM